MIEFYCKNCGWKISLPEIHSGKKYKCPKCKNEVIVPDLKETDSKQNVSRDIEVDARYSSYDLTLLDVPGINEAQSKELDEISESFIESTSRIPEASKEYEDTSVTERKCPWPVDIFLYPVCKPGLTIIGIVISIRWSFKLLVLLLGAVAMVFSPMIVFFGFVFGINIIVRIILVFYYFWYFCECIRDSAEGRVRAPETLSRTPGLGEMCWLFIRTLITLVIFSAPVFAYYQYIDQVDTTFWVLLAIAVFLLPMSFLASVTFDSFICINPVFLMASVFKTFFIYCLVAVLFSLLIFLIALIWLCNLKLDSLAIEFICYCVVLYLLLIIAHLFGRFLYRYKERLGWDF